jgi:hypothetical protein
MRKRTSLIAPGSLAAVLICWRRARRMDADRRRHGIDGGVCGGRLARTSWSACGAFPICAHRDERHGERRDWRGGTFLDLRAACRVVARISAAGEGRKLDWLRREPEPRHLGGNLVNGSPAADSSPALLAYDAEIETSPCAAGAGSLLRVSHRLQAQCAGRG